MIFSLTGQLDSVEDDFAIIDVQGVGYQVFVPLTVHSQLAEVGQTIKLYTFHHVREDAQTLYGFLSPADRQFFVLLTSVSGVGPKVGLKILSTIPASDLTKAILQADLALLTSVSGVGKKMAERLVLDLRDKLPKVFPSATGYTIKSTPQSVDQQLETDLTLALKTLGYGADEIKKSIQKAADQLTPEISLEDGVKILLKSL